MNGQDLNSESDQQPTRWAINFWDWSEERAQTYKKPWKIVEDRVKPERQRRKANGQYVLRNPLPQRWWQYGEKRPGLYHKIGRGHAFERHPDGWDPAQAPLRQVIAIPETTKYCAFSFVSNSIVLSHMLKVISSDSPVMLCILNSSIHECWARKQSSTLETRLKYITTTAFETFPFPTGSKNLFINLAELLVRTRSSAMSQNGIGTTALYNRFHSPDDNDRLIQELREAHRHIDEATANAFGWDNFDLGHGFHEVPYLPENDRVRFTISEVARLEVLRRLAELNRRRYQEEVDQGLHGEASSPSKGPSRRSRGVSPSEPTLDLGHIFPNGTAGGD